MTEPEYGTFAVDHAARRVRGILVPWGERSRTSASKTKPITFPRGSVQVPRDPSVVGLNFGHDRFSPVGRGALFEDQDSGLYAEFDIADTEEGDQWLKDRGEFVKLSAEVRDIVRDAKDQGVAKLTGAALVTEGAFESAALFAIDGTETRRVTPEEEEELAEDTDVADAPEEDESDDDPDEKEGDAVADATAKEVMLAGRGKPQPELTRRGFVNALFSMHNEGRMDLMAPYLRFSEKVNDASGGLFALADIKYDGTGGLNNNGQITGPQYLGELWEARPDVRTFIPSVGVQALQALTATGWSLTVPDTSLDVWAGNKAAIPSVTSTVAPTTFMAQRYAGGADIAREFFDFGNTEVIDAWTAAMVRLYQKKSDAYALTQILAGATTATPGTVPAGADKGMTAIIDLALQIQGAGGTPSVIRVAPNLYRTILLTLDGNQFAYMSASFGLQSADLAGLDIRADSRLANNQVLVLDRNGVGVWELPGSPLRVDAVAIANGGYDRAFFGYIAAGVVEAPVVLKATLV